MPGNIKDTRKLLSREEQQQAIDDLSKKKTAQQAEPERQAEMPQN
jgi:hypothetical protein